MARFGVYYVPPGDNDFYRFGSQLVGYDIREQKDLEAPSDFATAVSPFEPTWNRKAKPYGFHLTIGDAIDCKDDDLVKVEEELEELVHCFCPKRHPFLLTLRREKPISFWQGGTVVVLEYAANEHLQAFHDLVVARINPIGSGSGALTRLEESASHHEDYKVARIRKFFRAYILSSWAPHFTVLNPYGGRETENLQKYLLKKFCAPQGSLELMVESLCLVVQYDGASRFSIYKEISRGESAP